MKEMALVDKCTNYVNAHEHDDLDICFACAPYWNVMALCPTHKLKVDHITGYCKLCRRYYDMATFKQEAYRSDNSRMAQR